MRAFLISLILLGAAGCGGGGKAATVDFGATAGGICSAATSRLATLPDPGGTDAGIAMYATGAAQVDRDVLDRLRALVPPPAAATAWRLYLIRLQEFVAANEGIAAAARAHDTAKAGQLLGQARAIAEQARQEALAAGVAQCAE
jgi:hypothetical protein